MDFKFTDEQAMLRDSVAEFLKKECTYDIVKEIQDSPEGYSEKLWKKMAKLEWMGVCLPEEYGGFEDPYMSLMIIIEEMGKRAFPSPYFSTVVQCAAIIQEFGSEKQKKDLFPKITKGKMLLSLAQDEAGNLTAAEEEGRLIINGKAEFVYDANIADKLIVRVQTGAGSHLLLIDANTDGISVEKLPSIGNDNACFVNFENIAVPVENMVGEPGKADAMIDQLMPQFVLAESAKMLGGCKTAIDMAAAYARERVQYKVPIGSFQSIQHRLADMKIGYDTCLYYFYKIVWMFEQGKDIALDVSALKARLSEQYNFITYHAVRIYGGVGLTREFDVALFFRNAKASEFRMGAPAKHYEQVAGQLGL